MSNAERLGAPVIIVNSDAIRVALASREDTDTDGNQVPTNKAHSYTYDGSGNLKTDTVSDATGTWVRTYTYQGGNVATDSGWVKQ